MLFPFFLAASAAFASASLATAAAVVAK